MKRVFIAALTSLSLAVIPAYTATLRVDAPQAVCGDPIQLPVRVENAVAMSSLEFDITYDPGKLTITNVIPGSLTTGFSSAFNPAGTTLRVAMASGTPVSGTGTVALISININASAPTGRINLPISGAKINGLSVEAFDGAIIVSCGPTPASLFASNASVALVPGATSGSTTISNFGGQPATVTMSTTDTFFSQTPSIFTLGPGQSQSVQISATTTVPGSYTGKTMATSPGLAPTTTAVTLRIPPATAGTAKAVVQTTRVDLSELEGATPSGSIRVNNTGDGDLNGSVLPDQPFIKPRNPFVTIPKGQGVDVLFDIDRTRRPDAAALSGSASGQISILYQSTPGSLPTTAGANVNDTVKTQPSLAGIPPLATDEVAYVVPGIGHVTGSIAGSFFLSDVSVLNQSALPASALTLFFIPRDGSTPLRTTTKGIPGNTAVRLLDVALSNFQVSGVGSLLIRAKKSSRLSIAVGSFSVGNPLGLYGTAIPVFNAAAGVVKDGQIFLAGLRKDTVIHTNIFLQEAAGQDATVQLDYHDSQGAITQTRTLPVPAYRMVQLNNDAPAGAVEATITNVGTSGTVLGLATLVDEASGDTWTVADWGPQFGFDGTGEVFIPVAGHVTGANNANFRTDIAITNASNAAAVSTRITYFPQGSSRVDRTVVFPASTSLVLNDAAVSLFGVTSDSLGFMRVTPTGGKLVVTSRTYTAAPSGSFGTAVPTLSAASALRLSSGSAVIGPIDDAGTQTFLNKTAGSFRNNLGLMEVSGLPVTVKATVSYSPVSGSELTTPSLSSSKSYDLAGRQFMQISRIVEDVLTPATRSKFGDLRNVQLTLSVTGGDGAVLYYLASTENGTSDIVLRVQ